MMLVPYLSKDPTPPPKSHKWRTLRSLEPIPKCKSAEAARSRSWGTQLRSVKERLSLMLLRKTWTSTKISKANLWWTKLLLISMMKIKKIHPGKINHRPSWNRKLRVWKQIPSIRNSPRQWKMKHSTRMNEERASIHLLGMNRIVQPSQKRQCLGKRSQTSGEEWAPSMMQSPASTLKRVAGLVRRCSHIRGKI